MNSTFKQKKTIESTSSEKANTPHFTTEQSGPIFLCDNNKQKVNSFFRTDISEVLTLAGQVMCAPLNQSKLLPDGLDFTLRFYPAEPKKCFVSGKPDSHYCVEWISAKLKIARVLPNAAIGKQLFSYRQPIIYTFTHNRSVQTWGPRQILQVHTP